MIQFCYVFDGLLLTLNDELTKKESEIDLEEKDSLLVTKKELWEAMYIQACYWSFGASIVDEARSKFDEYIKKTCGLVLAKDTPAEPATASKLKIERNKLNTKI